MECSIQAEKEVDRINVTDELSSLIDKIEIRIVEATLAPQNISSRLRQQNIIKILLPSRHIC